ncbi:MAG: ABC transporter ATP-binding protein [Anaerolineae bacterium]|nr:ABC transporter ATP-binding protein [Anaerolineae bacterium]MDQ7037427.1 ABC transporter ATP-binding protein [Anaerolineae bacterium]
MLTIENLEAGYGDVKVLFGVSLEIQAGEIVALIGANGAGKTTTIKTLSGLLRARSGRIIYDGQDITHWQSHKIVAAGLIQVAEGRKLFPRLSVLENLELGSFLRKLRANRAKNLKHVYSLFPRLAERKNQIAGTLSGGEQQMLAIGRALMSEPKLLMLDEPSLGLAPMLVQDIFNVVQGINDDGTTILIVEQNAVQTLRMAQRGYVMEHGKITLSGTGDELLHDDRIRTAYLGL